MSKVSIIIPAYNVEKYIGECLDSLKRQTYNQFELIIINDGSIDRTKDIIMKERNNFNKIKIINQPNKGQSEARNKGLSLASGEYILFLDSDDSLKNETLDSLVKTIDKYEPDLIRFSAENIYSKEMEKLPSKKYDFSRFFTKNRVYSNKEFNEINIKAFTPSPVLYIFKKETLNKNNIKFDTSLRMFEDEIFTLKVFLNAESATYISNRFYRRRYRENSVMTTENDGSLEIRLVILEKLYELLKEYRDNSHQLLIKERIIVNNKIIFNTRYKNKRLKRKKMKEINNYSTIKYYYLMFYYNFRKFARTIKQKLSR